MSEPEYAAAQVRWERYWRDAQRPAPAVKWSGEADLRAVTWGVRAPEVVTVQAWQDPCGGYFNGALFRVYGVNERLTPLFKTVRRLSAAMVFDVDLDGSHEVLVFDAEGGVHLIAGVGDPQVVASYRPPSFGCRC